MKEHDRLSEYCFTCQYSAGRSCYALELKTVDHKTFLGLYYFRLVECWGQGSNVKNALACQHECDWMPKNRTGSLIKSHSPFVIRYSFAFGGGLKASNQLLLPVMSNPVQICETCFFSSLKMYNKLFGCDLAMLDRQQLRRRGLRLWNQLIFWSIL